MPDLSLWDVAILFVAAYLAIVTLVRLMRQRRDEVISELEAEIATQQRRKRAVARRERQQQSRTGQAARGSRAAKS